MKISTILFSVNTSSRTGNAGLLLMRMSLALLMLTHGVAKMNGYEALAATFPDPIGLGSTASLILILLAEVGCSVLILAGLCTRLATLPLIFGMIVAAFVQHGGDPFVQKELSVLYLLMFVVLLLLGAGKYSLDSIIQSRLHKKKE